jgi:hypothetical protein
LRLKSEIKASTLRLRSTKFSIPVSQKSRLLPSKGNGLNNPLKTAFGKWTKKLVKSGFNPSKIMYFPS